MKKPEIPENEKERLEELKEYSILDTLPEQEYEEITHLASYISETPISLITLIDENRQWFKSHLGLEIKQSSRNDSFCAHAINDKDNIFIVPDSRKDDRFHDNPWVLKDPKVIFYAGIPLISSNGYPLGTLCVIDSQPRELNDKQLKALKALSNQLTKLFEKRKQSIQLEKLNKELKNQNDSLNDFARVAAHDIKSPLYTIIMMTDLIQSEHSESLNAEVNELIGYIYTSSNQLAQLIDGILKHSKDTSLIQKNKENFDISQAAINAIQLADPERKATINLACEKPKTIFSNKVAIEQIFINLISNSLKYNDKEKTKINIEIDEDKNYYLMSMEDNGPGINEADKEKIFNIFETTSNTDKSGNKGTGIGLATVKTLIDGLGGDINVSSEKGKGTKFEFTIKKN